MTRRARWSTTLTRSMAYLGLAALGLLLATAWPQPSRTVGGEIRESPPREAFLSGGARSEIVLREISETLKRIDLRLERFERAIRDAEQQSAQQGPPLQDAGQEPAPPAGGENP